MAEPLVPRGELLFFAADCTRLRHGCRSELIQHGNAGQTEVTLMQPYLIVSLRRALLWCQFSVCPGLFYQGFRGIEPAPRMLVRRSTLFALNNASSI